MAKEEVKVRGGVGKQGNFFTVSVAVVKAIAEQTANADAVLAYLVLCKNKQRKTFASTGGAPAVASALGVSRHRANKLLELLSSVSLGGGGDRRAVMSVNDWNALLGEKAIQGKMGKFEVKVLPELGDTNLYLDNSFVITDDGRCVAGVEKLRDIPCTERLDAVKLLIELYEVFNLTDFGGINPKVLCELWQKQDQIDLVKRESYCHLIRFASTAVPTTKVTSRENITDLFTGDVQRFEIAFRNLRRSGILYKAAVAFSDDPLKGEAEVLYTLYDEVLNVGLKSAIKYAIQAHDLEEPLFGENGINAKNILAFTAPTLGATLLGVFRLRHARNAVDHRTDYALEAKRIERWKKALEDWPYHMNEPEEDEFDFDFEPAEYRAASV